MDTRRRGLLAIDLQDRAHGAHDARIDRVLRDAFWLAPRVATPREVTDLATWRSRGSR